MAKQELITKNLELLTNLMIFEAHGYKKCETYLKSVTDTDAHTLFEKMAENHKTKYQALLDYLNSHN